MKEVLSEVFIKFDGDPAYYGKEQYSLLLRSIAKSLLYLYKRDHRSLRFDIVKELPEIGEIGTVYLIEKPEDEQEEGNKYTEYLYLGCKGYELLGGEGGEGGGSVDPYEFPGIVSDSEDYLLVEEDEDGVWHLSLSDEAIALLKQIPGIVEQLSALDSKIDAEKERAIGVEGEIAEKASEAYRIATEAKDEAESANQKAAEAFETAQAAQTAANQAIADAAAAQADATKAITDASNAQATADDAISKIEVVDSNLTEVKGALDAAAAHIANDDIHVAEGEKAAWNAKLDAVADATEGNFASLDADGKLADSGVNAGSFDEAGTAAAVQTALVDDASEEGDTLGKLEDRIELLEAKEYLVGDNTTIEVSDGEISAKLATVAPETFTEHTDPELSQTGALVNDLVLKAYVENYVGYRLDWEELNAPAESEEPSVD
ncbi:MAG: hypothetical protein Q4C49_00320 [Bacillota bacterium]|nr:hypothetical protein [Bacillota bacterium]